MKSSRRTCVPSAAVLALAGSLVVACASAPSDPTQAKPLLARSADVVVKNMMAPGAVQMVVGQTLGIVTTADGASWQVDYDEDRLTLLTPKDRVQQPGDEGWVWRAAAPGRVEIVLTTRPPCPNPPCPPNPARMTVTVDVRARV